MTTATIRIILADDHQLVRDSWKMLLENNPDLIVIATCNNNQEAIDDTKRLQPDILLIDINMASPQNGLSVTQTIAAQLPNTKILGLSVSNQPKYAIRMIELGGMGYLTKTSTLEEINHGIREVHAGRKYIAAEVKARMTPAEREQYP